MKRNVYTKMIKALCDEAGIDIKRCYRIEAEIDGVTFFTHKINKSGKYAIADGEIVKEKTFVFIEEG